MDIFNGFLTNPIFCVFKEFFYFFFDNPFHSSVNIFNNRFLIICFNVSSLISRRVDLGTVCSDFYILAKDLHLRSQYDKLIKEI